MKYFLNDEYEYNFNLIGISCHEKDYRLCWAINQSLKISLEKEDENLEVLSNKTKGMSSHSLYYYKNEDTKNEFYLIKNRSSFGILIPEQSQADYLLMIKENYAFNLTKVENEIKNLSFVLTAFIINVESLKSKENLIF